MSSAHPKRRFNYSITALFLFALNLLYVGHAISEAQSDAAFLNSVQKNTPAQKEEPVGSLFADIIESHKEIAFLAERNRYEDLLKVLNRLHGSVDQISKNLSVGERQRAARFTAASRSLAQLSKAIHNFMWNGQEESLVEANDKLGQLLDHIETLIKPEELAQARKYQQLASATPKAL